MLTVIENVLSAEEVRQFREKLASADWRDGAATAGTRSVAVKQNLQLDRRDPLALELGNTILRKLGHNPVFVSAALAEKIWPPVFNCYQDGGHYGTHSDAALMRLPDRISASRAADWPMPRSVATQTAVASPRPSPESSVIICADMAAFSTPMSRTIAA